MNLWALRADGTDAQLLVRDSYPSLAWSADGTQLLATPDDGVIKIADVGDEVGPFVDTGFRTEMETACADKMPEPRPCQDAAFAFSPDGGRIVFIQRCTGGEQPGCMFLTVLDLRTGERTELADTVEEARFGIALPSWSADGKQIVFVRETNAGVIGAGGRPTSNLYVIDADGTNLHQVDLGGLSVTSPRWSADGTTILMATNTTLAFGDIAGDVYTVKPDGSDLQQLTSGGTSAWPEWTGDGRIRVRTGGDNQFWVMDSDGDNAEMLVDLTQAIAMIDPEGYAVHMGVPGDPGRTFYWQPTGSSP